MNKTPLNLFSSQSTVETATKQSGKRWLLAFEGFTALTNLLFISAIWVIYLTAHGYSPLDIGLFEMVFHLVKFVAEVPAGIFADLLGRRKSLIMYCLIGAMNNLLFLVPTVPLLTLSFILSGVSFAFKGGADEALLWTITGHIAPQNQSASYSKLASRILLIALLCEMIGTASGGYLGNILQTLPFLCASAKMVLSIIPLLFIPEQLVNQSSGKRASPLHHFGKGLKVVRHNPVLLGLLLISGIIQSCGQTIYFYYQLYLHGLGFSLGTIGLLISASTLSAFLFTALAPWFMRILTERWLVPTFVLIQVLGLFLMSLPQPFVSLTGYLICFQAAIAVLTPAISTYVNQRSPEGQRVTILSFQTGLYSAAMIVLFPLFGLGITHASYSTVYLWALLALIGGSVFTGGIVWAFQQVRYREDDRK